MTPSPSPTQGVEQSSRGRQDIVSCQLCRSKKLKCDRQQPCSNCSQRGVVCEPSGPRTTPGPRKVVRRTGVGNENQHILNRLRRVEALLGISAVESSANDDDDNNHAVPSTTSPAATTNRPVLRAGPNLVDLADIGPQDTASNLERTWSTAASALETWSDLAEDITVRIAPAGTSFRQQMKQSSKCIWLPPMAEAECLFETYADRVEHLQHVLHIPTARRQLHSLYQSIQTEDQVNYSHVALVLCIIASTTFYWTPMERDASLTWTAENSSQISIYWVKAALDVLDHTRRIGSGTLEEIQASTILFFMMYNTEGISARARAVAYGAIAMARDMSLHKLDLQGSELSTTSSRQEVIDREVKRRLWWYLASSDWSMAAVPGPQEGSYTVLPKHMKVDMPGNIEDEDFDQRDPHFARPISEPTSMSYFIQRIRYAEICRHISDVMPLGILADHATYQDILAVDSSFRAFYQELPVFFRLDDQSRRESRHVDERLPYVAVHRYVLGFLVPARRCLLHQRFLARGMQRPYNLSRDACVQSARDIIQNKKALDISKLPSAPSFLRQFAATQTVFMAATVFAMDICYNRTPEQETRQRADLVDAWQVLDSLKSQTRLVDRHLAALDDVLRKHNIQVPVSTSPHLGPEVQLNRSEQQYVADTECAGHMATASFSTFDEIWQEIQPGAVEMPDWTFTGPQLDQIMSEI